MAISSSLAAKKILAWDLYTDPDERDSGPSWTENDGTGAVSYVTGQIDGAVKLEEANSESLSIANANSGLSALKAKMAAGDPITVTMWFKPVSYDSSNAFMGLLNFGAGGGGNLGIKIALRNTSPTRLYAYHEDSSTRIGEYGEAPTTGSFNFGIIRFDPDGDMGIKVNAGTERTKDISAHSGNSYEPTVDLEIATAFVNAGDVEVSNLAFWDGILTSGEEAELYNSGSGDWFADGDDHTLATNELSVSSTLDATTITQNHVLSPVDSSVSVSLDTTTITQGSTLDPADLSVSTTLDTTTITQVHILSPGDLAVSIALDTTTVTEENDDHTLAPADLSVSTSLDTTTITQSGVLAPNDMSVSSTLGGATITQNHILGPLDLSVTTTLDTTLVILPSDVSTASISLGATHTGSVSLGTF